MQATTFFHSCYYTTRAILRLLDTRSLSSFSCVNKDLHHNINHDENLFQQLIQDKYHLNISKPFLEKKLKQLLRHYHPLSPPPSLAKFLHASLETFDPSHLSHIKSTRISTLSSPNFVGKPSRVFFIKSKLIFVTLLQPTCHIHICDIVKLDVQRYRKLPPGVEVSLALSSWIPAHALAVENSIWLLGSDTTKIAIFDLKLMSWEQKEIAPPVPSGPRLGSRMSWAYHAEKKMLVCVAQTQHTGFYLYFLDVLTCTWVKLIQCLDMETNLLSSATQLICDGSNLIVILTSISGHLHFMQINCDKWEMDLLPVVGQAPYENPRELLSLFFKYIPWHGTMLMYGARWDRNVITNALEQTISVYQMQFNPTKNHWFWNSNTYSFKDNGMVKASFIHEGNLFLCTKSNLHVLDIFENVPLLLSTASKTTKRTINKTFSDESSKKNNGKGQQNKKRSNKRRRC